MPADTAEIWSISQLTRRVKSLLENQIGQVWISGEISNWKVAASGHAYFTLKDADSQIDAVMFKGRLSRLRFDPESGQEVLALGRITVYERRGNYQIILEEMQPRGVGALQLAFDKLKKKLSDEGLFDESHKKPLPLLPQRIGIVTSPTGAAIRDILHVLDRRFANVHVLIHPARVQGDGAAAEIVAGIRALDAWGVDVMIVGRGGGSLEDLWPFNEEAVVRAVFEAKTPIISAVGHEVDFSLSDFAADLRAPTPSAAAEVVVKEQQALVEGVTQLRARLGRALQHRLEGARRRLAMAQRSYVFERPDELIRQRRQEADELRMRLEDALGEQARTARDRLRHATRALALLSPDARLQRVRERSVELRSRLHAVGGKLLDRPRHEFANKLAKLNALSPIAILTRGYALAWKMPERTLLRNANETNPGDAIEVRLGRGMIAAKVERIEEEPHA